MLALTRKKGEALVINNNIEITVLEIRGDQIKLGITAPCAGSVLLWIFPVTLPEWPECGLLPFRKNGWDALSFCEYRT